MINKEPLVSIIISAYNAEKYIEQTLQSILAQTWKSLEIIVVNDGSTDNTASIVKRYANNRIKLVTQANKGQDAALNEGYRHSIGSYIKYMDSDDLLNPEMIERQMQALSGSNDYVAYGEWSRFFYDQPGKADFTKMDYWKNMMPLDFLTASPGGVMLQCGIMLVPRKLIEKAGLWDERLILFNDTEFFTRVLLKSKGIKFSPGARLYYRSGMMGSISVGRARKFYESTYLATNLMAEKLLTVEDSPRIRNLISNTFLMQYYHMYPRYPDLVKLHEEKIAFFGFGDYHVEDGGKVFKTLTTFLGWKTTKRLQMFFYKLGYLKLLYKIREEKAKKQIFGSKV